MINTNDPYFNWLVSLIDDGRAEYYTELIEGLYSTEFYYSVEHDENRYEDGRDLRYRFVENEIPFDTDDISNMGRCDCSVLEVMIAVSTRMEDILYDPDFGCQIPKWFWIMVENLELDNLTDRNFDSLIFDETMEKLLKREYGRDGKGSLFPIKNYLIDQRKTEIWYQMAYFIDENFGDF